MSQELYNQHLKLTDNIDNSFYCTRQTVDGRQLEIFNYRLVSWGQFLLPGAMEARGITYDVTDGAPVVICRPMPKFFNFTEGTEKHVGMIRTCMDKRDGSLISSSLINGKLFVKSKGSFYSEQAVWAQQMVDKDEYLLNLMLLAEEAGYTANLEFTAPFNRIVIPYQKVELRMLNIRHRVTGDMLYGDALREFYKVDYRPEYFVDYVVMSETDLYAKMHAFSLETVGEGYVCEIVRPDGSTYLVKQKNDCYSAKHKLKDSITHSGNLADCVINGSADDLRAMFHDDEYTLARISKYEQMIIPKFNKWVNEITQYAEDYAHLTAKEFAIQAKAHFGNSFVWAMNLYRKQEVDFAAVARKYKEEMFGISTVTKTVDLE